MTTNLEDIERRLSRLESIAEIQELQVEYAAACDANYDPDRIAALFAEDGVWDGGEALGTCIGREAIRDHFAGTHARVLWAMHFMIAPKIDVDQSGSTARGWWYLLEPATLASADGPTAYWIATVYEIDYVRSPSGQWLFQRMAFSGGMRAPYASGWAV